MRSKGARDSVCSHGHCPLALWPPSTGRAEGATAVLSLLPAPPWLGDVPSSRGEAQALTNSERRPEAPDKEEGTAAGPLRNSSVQVPQNAARPGLCLAFTLINKSFSEKQ